MRKFIGSLVLLCLSSISIAAPLRSHKTRTPALRHLALTAPGPMRLSSASPFRVWDSSGIKPVESGVRFLGSVVTCVDNTTAPGTTDCTLTTPTSLSLTCGGALTCSPSTITGTGSVTLAAAGAGAATYGGGTSYINSATLDAYGRVTAFTTAAPVGRFSGSFVNTQVLYGTNTNTIGGSNNFAYAGNTLTLTVLGIGTTQSVGLDLQNTTASTSSAVQYSPMFWQYGTGWTGSASQSVGYGWQVQPTTTSSSYNLYSLYADYNGTQNNVLNMYLSVGGNAFTLTSPYEFTLGVTGTLQIAMAGSYMYLTTNGGQALYLQGSDFYPGVDLSVSGGDSTHRFNGVYTPFIQDSTTVVLKSAHAAGSATAAAVDTTSTFGAGDKFLSLRNNGTEMGRIAIDSTSGTSVLDFVDTNGSGISGQSGETDILVNGTHTFYVTPSTIAPYSDNTLSFGNATHRMTSVYTLTLGAGSVQHTVPAGTASTLATIGNAQTFTATQTFAGGAASSLLANIDFSGSSGVFKTTTGAVTVGGTSTFTKLPTGNYGGTSSDLPSVTWTAPTLQNSWTNVGSPYSGTGYYKDSLGMVHVRIAVTYSGGQNLPIFTLPAGFRPSQTMYVVCVGDTTTSLTDISITTAGVIAPTELKATQTLLSEYIFTPAN